jgi:hypothetical protein
MAKLYQAVSAVILAILLVTQPGCVTQALFKLGEPTKGPREQPVHYTRALRNGRVLALEFDSTIDADGTIHSVSPPSAVRVDLTTVEWMPLWGFPIDPYCTREMWARLLPNPPPQPPVALTGRPAKTVNIALLHKQRATGIPPMSVQVQDLDAWIVCGAGDAIGVARVPAPPPPVSGETSTAATVAIVLLFPFALAIDITFGIVYVVAAFAR